MLVLVPDLPSAHSAGRSSVLDVVAYDLDVDLTAGADTFFSRTEIRFRCQRAGISSFADLEAVGVRRAVLNGANLDLSTPCHAGHLPLPRLAHENVLVVEAEMGYTSARAGLYRAGGLDSSACVYSKGYPDGARHIYCCFDQEDLRAPFTVSMNAPAGWSCIANGPVVSRPADDKRGMWQFAATPPIAPYLSGFCAGPYLGPAFICQRDNDLPLPVTLNALPAVTALQEAVVGPELFQRPLWYYERVLGAAYPYAKCDLVFVPQYPALAFGVPGLMTIQDQVLTQAANDKSGLYLAAVIAHELAHAWFGGLVDTCGRDGWLIEGLATYISRGVLEESHPDIDPWEASISQMLPDHAYIKYAAPVRQLAELIGRQAVLSGLSSLMHDYTHGCITKDDLIRCWSRASGRDLREWAAETLLPAANEEETP
jgi:aminopeptidase N